MNLELCTDCVEGAVLAGKYGFKRIELCSALSEGGLTPGAGLIRMCSQASSVEVHAMVRTRGGSFECSDEELEVMRNEVEIAAREGAKGVVFGILDSKNEISTQNESLVRLAHNLGLQATFHRAFDQLRDPLKSVDQLVTYGFDRLLTSGGQNKAIDGLELIVSIHEIYGNQLEIMAGSGVGPENALDFADSGLTNLHFSARKPTGEAIVPGMGIRMVTDESKMQSMRELFS